MTDSHEKLAKYTAEANRIALDAALNHKNEIQDCINTDIPQIFGDKWARDFFEVRERLSEKYGDKLQSLIFLAVRKYVYGCHNSAAFMRQCFEEDGGSQNAVQEQLSTPKGYADYEGWAYTLYNEMANIDKRMELLIGTRFEDFPCDEDILLAMSIFWFFDAALIFLHNNMEGMDVLFEAADAKELANGLQMWAGAEDISKENILASKAKQAEIMNLARHRGNYEAKDRAIKEWEKDTSKFSSAEKAGNHLADWLVNQGFIKTIEPRTVTGWIRVYAKQIGVRFR